MGPFFENKRSDAERRLSARTLRIENLENRELLSASTMGEIALIADLATTAEYANPNEIANIDLSEISNAIFDASNPVVTSAADDGSEGTLRYAVENAAEGATITIDSSLDGQTITLVGGQININKSLTIFSDYNVTVDAHNDSRIFMVAGTPAVEIDGLTLVNGLAEYGGAIYVGTMDRPATPSDVESVYDSENAKIDVTWTPSEDADSYAVYVVVDGGEPQEVEINPDGASATLENVEPGSDYTFVVVATNDAGDSDPATTSSKPISATANEEDGVITVTVEPDGATVEYTWSYVDENGDAVVIDVDGPTYRRDDETAGREITVKVVGTGDSENSSVTLTVLPEAPNAPQDLVANYDATDNTITVTWTPESDALTYTISYVDSEGNSYGPFELDGDVSEYVVADVEPGVVYTFTVVASNDGGDSEPAIVSCAVPGDETETPSLVVNSEGDAVDDTDGLVTLREALAYAVQYPELGDTITFASNVQTISLTAGELVLDSPVNIVSSDKAVTIDAGGASRIFNVSADATLDGLTLANGAAGANGGGAINHTSGALTVKNADFEGNTANGGAGSAIRQVGGTLEVSGSKFMSNGSSTTSAGATGSVYVSNSSAEFKNVLFAENKAYRGAGIYGDSSATTTLRNVTISNNDADAGAGVYFNGGTAYIYNSLILYNNGKDTAMVNNVSGAVDALGCPDVGQRWNKWSGPIINNVSNSGNSWFFSNDNILDATYHINVSRIGRWDRAYILDAGVNNKLAADMTTDLDGGARKFNFTGKSEAIVDLGAFEAKKDVPSGYVTTASDVVDENDGLISLREALKYLNPYWSGVANPDYATDYIAQNGKVIQFSGELAGQTISVDLGEMNVAIDGLTIDGGVGDERVTLDAQGSSLIFDVKKYDSIGPTGNVINVTLKDLVLTGGDNATDGAVVFDSHGGSITIDNVDFVGNGSATSNGGALTLMEGDATITNSRFADNVAGKGGAIWIQNQHAGIITIDGVDFENNSAATDGGAIYIQNGTDVTIKNGSFSGNVAGNWGGVFVVQSNAEVVFDNMTTTGNSAKNGGVGYVVGGRATYKNSSISQNSATERGGAFYVANSSASYLNVSSSTLSGNAAGIKGPNVYTPAGSAATIIGATPVSGAKLDPSAERFVESIVKANRVKESTISVSNATLDSNSVAKATLTLRNVTIQSSTATADGGAVYLTDGALNVYDSTISDNAAYNGAGLYVNAGDLVVENATFSGNVATYGGGALGLFPTADGATATDVVATIADSTFTANVGGNRGGAIYAKYATVDVENGVFSENVATSSYGGAIYYGAALGSVIASTFDANNAGQYGGALYVYDSPIQIGTEDESNEFASNGAVRGGAIYQSKNAVGIVNATFSANEATEQGGAIFAGNNATTNVSNSTFEENVSELYGGALALNRATINLTEGAIFSENAAQTGGAVYNYNGTLAGTGATFASNSSNKSGGAVYLEKATADLVDAVFTENVAKDYGAAVYDGTGSTATFSGGEFSNNSGAKIGGAIFAHNATLNLGVSNETPTVLSGNASRNYGGAITLSEGAQATFVDAVFNGNTTYKQGAAVYVANSTLTATGGAFESNTCERGGAIYAKGGAINLTDVDFVANEATATTGGAIAASTNATLTIDGGSFVENVAKGTGGAVMAYATAVSATNVEFARNEASDGGAVFASFGGSEAPATFVGCAFDGNVAAENGGAIAALGVDLTVSGQTSFEENESTRGGAIYANKSTLDVANASFVGNKASQAGGAFHVSDATSNATIVNALVAENEAPSASGLYFSYASYSIVNATVTANVGDVVLRSVNATNGSIVNSIIAGNSSDDVYLKGDLAADYVLSAFDGWTSGDNNIEFDPAATLFSDDYRLADGSPAIDAGDSDAVTTDVDLAGNARIVGSAVDLGAYEYAGSNATLATLDDAFADLFVEDVDVEL